MFRSATYSDEWIVSSILKGGRKAEEAMAFLLKKHHGSVLQFVRTRNGSTEDAEDVLQDAVTQLILNIRKGTFKGESSLHTYLFGISKRLWFKRFRKIRRDDDYRNDPENPDSGSSRDPEGFLIDKEQKNLLSDLFDRLKPKCKEILFLWAMSYSMTEIAEKVEYGSPQVAMNKKNKCLKELTGLIGENPGIGKLLEDLQA
jgi:RNA polymerase sigma-70 factor (ECF subfamily)